MDSEWVVTCLISLSLALSHSDPGQQSWVVKTIKSDTRHSLGNSQPISLRYILLGEKINAGHLQALACRSDHLYDGQTWLSQVRFWEKLCRLFLSFCLCFRPTNAATGQKESFNFNFDFDIDSREWISEPDHYYFEDTGSAQQWPAAEDTGSRVMNVTGDSLR